MRYGRALLALLGLSLVAVGAMALRKSNVPAGGVLLAVGLVAFVLGVADWREFEAQFRALRLKATRGPLTVPPPSEVRMPELKILSLEERGGHSSAIDFAAEVVNEGTRLCRAEVTASIDGRAVECHPSVLDLPANQPPQHVRILVPRPDLGDLVKAFDSAATLYGRTLTLTAVSEEHRAERPWSEHIYTDEENAERQLIQQREWRIGQGEASAADDEADARDAARQRLIDRHGESEA